MVKRTNTEKYEDVANTLLENHEAIDLVAALLNEMSRDQVKVHITPERPLKGHGGGRGRSRGGYRGNNSHSRGGYRGSRDNNSRGGHDRRNSSGRSNKFVIKNKH